MHLPPSHSQDRADPRCPQGLCGTGKAWTLAHLCPGPDSGYLHRPRGDHCDVSREEAPGFPRHGFHGADFPEGKTTTSLVISLTHQESLSVSTTYPFSPKDILSPPTFTCAVPVSSQKPPVLSPTLS